LSGKSRIKKQQSESKQTVDIVS